MEYPRKYDIIFHIWAFPRNMNMHILIFPTEVSCVLVWVWP